MTVRNFLYCDMDVDSASMQENFLRIVPIAKIELLTAEIVRMRTHVVPWESLEVAGSFCCKVFCQSGICNWVELVLTGNFPFGLGL